MFDAFVEECPQRLERHRRDQFISKEDARRADTLLRWKWFRNQITGMK